MPTKDELETENAELLAALQESTADVSRETSARRPARPDYLSAGETDDLINNGVTTSPFDGAQLNALDLGITPGNPEALRNAERERAARADVSRETSGE